MEDLASHFRGIADPDTVSDEEADKAGLVHDLFYRAQAARKPLMAQWRKNYRVLNNNVWAPRAEPWIAAPSVAKIWPVCASIVSWVTDQRPDLETVPTATPFTPYADMYQQLSDDMNVQLKLNFASYNLDGEIAKAGWDVLTYGIGYFKTEWCAWLADGLGDTIFKRVDPYTLYPDPYARNDAELNFIVEAKVMSVQDVVRSWPHTKTRLPVGMLSIDTAPHKLDANINAGQDRRVNFQPLAPSTASHAGLNTSGRQLGYNADAPVVVVLECWVRGLKEIDGHVYDCWKCVVACGRSVIMEAEATEIYGHNRHPYDRWVLFDTGEWYGPCLVEFLTSPQESINRTLAAIESNLQLMGDPMLVESPYSQSRRSRITNKPGARIEAMPADVAWMQPPQMQPQIAVELMTYYENQIESISGMTAMVRGFQPGGRNSSSTMDSVQDAAFVRIRGTLRELERALKGVCSKMVANIAEFYTEPRVMSILGPDEGAPIIKMLRAQHFYITDPTSADPAERIPLRFNVTADAGSQLMTSKQARAAQSIQLYALGAIDVPELLKAQQWPSAGRVAKRVMEQQAQAGVLGQPPGARQKAGRTQ